MRVSSSAAVRSKAGRPPSPARRIADAPVHRLRRAGELGADLPHAVAEADDVVEALVGELAEVLGAAAREIDPALAHHPHRVGVQGLGMAAGAGRAHRAVGEVFGQRLGHLRARAVAGAQEQHARLCRAAASVCAHGGRQPWMQRRTGGDEQLTAARQLEDVVGVAAVGEAAAGRHQFAVAQLTQVVGDQALALAGQLAQLADTPIAARQFAQEPPAQRMAGELEKPRRRGCLGSAHGERQRYYIKQD